MNMNILILTVSLFAVSAYAQNSLNGNISSYFSHYVNTRNKISSFTGNLSIEGNYYSTKDKQTLTDI